MSRPKRKRIVEAPPPMEGFKPFGIPMKNLEPVILLYEEYEAIRLADYERLTHEQAAEQMKVSRPTFTRIYEKARQHIAEAFVEGKAIFIEGGDFQSDNYWYKCESCKKLNIHETMSGRCSYCNSGTLRLLNKIPAKNEYQ